MSRIGDVAVPLALRASQAAAKLAADWDRMKEEAESLFRATEDVACGEKEGNPWDAVLR